MRLSPSSADAWRPVRSSGFLSSGNLSPFTAAAGSGGAASPALGRPLRRLGRGAERRPFHTSRLRASRASVAQETAWNGSTASSARGSRSATASAIQRAPSAVTTSIASLCSSVSRSRNSLSLSFPWPLQAHTTLPRSWSTTTVMYLWPFL